MTLLNADEATVTLESYLHEAIAALPEQPGLRPLRDGRRHCVDPVTDEDLDTVTISRGFWLDDVQADRVPACVAALREYWTEHGFEIRAETTPAEQFITVENADGYQMSIVVSAAGVLSIDGATPCVLPD